MRIVLINSVCNGSTGKIMGDIERVAIAKGHEVISLYGRRKGYNDIPCKKICNNISFLFHVFITTIFDRHGLGSYFSTKRMIRYIRKFDPDIIHIHNIHGYYVNIPILFNYLKKEFKGKVFWTLHDCWAFTGHCPHFELANCYKWKSKCFNCPNKKKYPISLLLDNSKNNYELKKKLFTGLNNLTLITPSVWLNSYIKESFLKEYKSVIINNGIDLNIFKKTEYHDIRIKYGIPLNKKIILSVASVWVESKGLNDFVKLDSIISEEYIIVLVGLNKAPKNTKNIISIPRTDNQKSLVELYNEAYVFLNLTYEDNYPTVNLEAIACGTPVITYDTGGCKEQVDESTGIVLKNKSIHEVYDKIMKINNLEFDNKNILKRIDKNILFKKYIDLYESSD